MYINKYKQQYSNRYRVMGKLPFAALLYYTIEYYIIMVHSMQPLQTMPDKVFDMI